MVLRETAEGYQMEKAIIINDKNMDRISAAIAEAEGKATARTIDVKDIVRACETIEGIREMLIEAEDKGHCYNGVFGADEELCTYWVTDDYIITYLTDDPDFGAGMLTEDQMDDLIVEER